MNNEEKNILQKVSASLKIPAEWLENLIRFESGFNPLARNKITGARGLIQFMPSTASEMCFQGSKSLQASIKSGIPTAADTLVSVYPDIKSQLAGPVYNYLKKLAPFPTEQSLYMSVFYPVARNWPIEKPFPEIVQKQNPGIKTVLDYVKKVNRKFSPVPIVLLLAIGALTFYILKGEKSIWHSHHETKQLI